MSNQSDLTYQLPETLPTNPILVDLLPDFASQWLHDLTVTWSSLRESNDLEGLRRLGHTIKGSFMQFGFNDLAIVGKEIMVCAENDDWEGASQRVNGLRTAMETLASRVQPHS